MLAMMLFIAAATNGQLRTRLVGSAFDPATVSVALSPRQRFVSTVQAIQHDGAHDQDGCGSWVPAACDYPSHDTGLQERLAHRPEFPREVVVGHPRLLALPLGARAPPPL